MIFTLSQIKEASKAIAPTFKFDPALIVGIAKQESARTPTGDFDASVVRLEQNFYHNYIASKMNLTTTSEALLACSFGCWQLMGLSLWELGYFKRAFVEAVDTIPERLDLFCVDLTLQCEFACRHLSAKRDIANKMASFKGETDKEKMTLLLWNGGSAPNYANEVLSKKEI